MNFATTTLRAGGFTAQIMEADRLVGESVFGLPPGNSLAAYQVKQFNQRPAHWMETDGWVVVVKPNKGLWFNWTHNDAQNTAILPSVKGCNPITGVESDGFALLKTTVCPRHPNATLNSNNYCPECGYSLPPQNFVSAPNRLWWDGFRADDGSVRQFFFTEDEARDVATHLIGKENTVPAFGFAFYGKKAQYKKEVERSRGVTASLGGGVKFKSNSMNCLYSKSAEPISKGGVSASLYSDVCCSTLSSEAKPMMDMMDMSMVARRMGALDAPERNTKDVSVGAGARIDQRLDADTTPIDHWNETPDAVMRIYFIFEDEFVKWRQFGMKCIEDVESSMLSGIPVG